eukprot:m.51317 g.51317  ORF g.51317 m.51317 type:complete len:773 (-) comp10727_c0_seq2:170-2488(-)
MASTDTMSTSSKRQLQQDENDNPSSSTVQQAKRHKQDEKEIRSDQSPRSINTEDINSEKTGCKYCGNKINNPFGAPILICPPCDKKREKARTMNQPRQVSNGSLARKKKKNSRKKKENSRKKKEANKDIEDSLCSYHEGQFNRVILEDSNLKGKILPFKINEDNFTDIPTDLRNTSAISPPEGLPLLFRPQMYESINQLNEQINKGSFSSHIVLSGAAGSGKSTTLFLVVQYARLRGDILVLYVIVDQLLKKANPLKWIAGQLLEYHKNLLGKLPEVSGILKEMYSCQKDCDRNRELFGTLVAKLKEQQSIPVLLAIDQWNAIFKEYEADCSTCSSETQTYIKAFFGNTNPFKLGTMLLAVSSSFDPIDKKKFQDADYQNACVFLKPYTEVEWKTVLDAVIGLKLLAITKDEDRQRLATETGRLPRLLLFALQAHKQQEDPFEGIRQKAGSYYNGRVKKLFLKAGEEEKKEIFKASATLVTHRKLESLSRLCEISGLFSGSDQEGYFAICPIVHQKLVSNLHSQDYFHETLKILLKDKETSWRAFELAIGQRLTGAKFDFRNPMSINQEKLSSLTFEVKKRHDQRFVGDVGDFNELERGTAYICYTNHPVVDVVIFDTDAKLIFMQISESPYQRHASRAPDLWDPKIKIADRYKKGASKVETILKYYSSKLPKNDEAAEKLKIRISSFLNRRKVSTLPEDVYYVYVTKDAPKELHKNNSALSDASFVHVLHSQHLLEFTTPEVCSLVAEAWKRHAWGKSHREKTISDIASKS